MKALAFLSFLLFALSGCTRYYYAPNQHNVPLFKEKHEARLSGTFSTVAEANGVEVQAAYAPTKRLGLIGSACFLGLNAPEAAKARLYELGAGYFKAIHAINPRVSEKFVFEVYGVAGLGMVKNYTCHPQHVAANIFKGYLQPALGYSNDIIDVFFSAKIGALHFYDIHETLKDPCYPDPESYYQYTNAEARQDLLILRSNQTSFLFEPAVSIRLGFQYVKAQCQLGWSFLNSDLQELNTGLNFNIGLVIAFAPRFLAKNKVIKGIQY